MWWWLCCVWVSFSFSSLRLLQVADGTFSSINGGDGNKAIGPYTSVTGGRKNVSTTRTLHERESEGEREGWGCPILSQVHCGAFCGRQISPLIKWFCWLQTAEGTYAYVTGGEENTASGTFCSVNGGQKNVSAPLSQSLGTHTFVDQRNPLTAPLHCQVTHI